MPRLKLDRELQSRDIVLSPGHLARLEAYWTRLSRWNRAMNLTALEGEARLARLIVEPLWALERLRPEGNYVDIGSGNGSPAIPWLVCGNFRRGDLIESRKKRAVFLRQTCRALELSECAVHACRFSDFVATERGKNPQTLDWITLQGVKALAELWSQISQIRGPRTRIAWLTGPESTPPEAPSQTLLFPGSTRRALIFGQVES